MPDQDWRMIDEEHGRFLDMLARLKAVIRNSRDGVVGREAVDVIRERMAIHCKAEEDFIRPRDPAANAVLARHHQVILEALARLTEQVGKLPKDELLVRVNEVSDMIETHERDVDVPLFRNVADRA